MTRAVAIAEVLSVGSPTLPTTARGLAMWIEGRLTGPDDPRVTTRRGRGGGRVFDLSLFPAEVQTALGATLAPVEKPSKALWSEFERLPTSTREEAERRLRTVQQVDLLAAGISRHVAVSLAASGAGVSERAVWRWLEMVAGVPAPDRLPALAPRRRGRTTTSDCDPRAWDFLVSLYLQPEQRTFATCHRRMTEAAAEQGWSPIPSAKTLQRRIEREIPRTVRTIAREGRDSAARVFPHQTRDRAGAFHAMQAVNADGHRLDVFVRLADGRIGRIHLVAIQDLHSGMILAWRLSETENWTAVRGAFANLLRDHGVPEHVYFDNGRAFASKWLTGGMRHRFRFKVRDEEPAGLLTLQGIQVHWTTPYHGQAKPIERAFRDLAEEIAKHPRCAGAYTGNNPTAKPENYGSRAVSIEVLSAVVAAEIARHNARPGRRAAACAGRSFADTFRASLALPETIVRRATAEQRRMFLLAAEGVTARKPTGEVVLAENRYWAEPLADVAGRAVTVRFDPDDLSQPVAVYTHDGRFVCDAARIEASRFDDMQAAQAHARAKRSFLKASRDQLEAERRLGIEDVAALMPAPAPMQPIEMPRVVRMVAGGRPESVGEVWDGAAGFGRAVRAMAADSDAAILPFRKEEGAA